MLSSIRTASHDSHHVCSLFNLSVPLSVCLLSDPLSTPLLSTTPQSALSTTVSMGFSPTSVPSVTFHPVGAINRAPAGRPITATVPVTVRPPRRPQGPRTPMCEGRVTRGVQWPPTHRGERVERPCPKGSLGQ